MLIAVGQTEVEVWDPLAMPAGRRWARGVVEGLDSVGDGSGPRVRVRWTRGASGASWVPVRSVRRPLSIGDRVGVVGRLEDVTKGTVLVRGDDGVSRSVPRYAVAAVEDIGAPARFGDLPGVALAALESALVGDALTERDLCALRELRDEVMRERGRRAGVPSCEGGDHGNA